MPTPITATLSLTGITTEPATVVAGDSAKGTATLSGAAPSGGATVSLSSDNGLVMVPSNVVVVAGQTSATFTISSNAKITVSSVVHISGSFGGVSQNATLTVSPLSQIENANAIIARLREKNCFINITSGWRTWPMWTAASAPPVRAREQERSVAP